MKEEVSNSMEPSKDDLEMWLEFQAGQLGTPAWWEELGAVPGIEDRHKFACKIRGVILCTRGPAKSNPRTGLHHTSSPQGFG